MKNILKVGLVGANASGKGWAPVAHIPALRGIDEIEFAAVCTTSPESAAAAVETYGVQRGFHDVGEMAGQPDIDAVAVVVRAAHHHEAVMAALAAGKPTYCEWPLGTSIDQTEEMVALAREKGVATAVGLQGRFTPALRHVRQLVRDGWVGELLSVDVVMTVGGKLNAPSEEAWARERKKGAHFFNIVGGHTLDTLLFCAGPLTAVSATVATSLKNVRFADTGGVAEVDTPDTVVFHGALDGGGLVSFRGATLPSGASGWRMELNGTKGRLVATTGGLPQITPVEVRGAQGDAELSVLEVPTGLDAVPAAVPGGPARNVAGVHQGFARAIQAGADFHPDFAHALAVHRLMDALVLSSAEGRTVDVSALASEMRS
jgi:predicted dehydrogenase